jgi:hypothetical protein
MSAHAVSMADPAPSPVPPCRPCRSRSRRALTVTPEHAARPDTPEPAHEHGHEHEQQQGLGWSEPEIAELARLAPGLLPGRIMTCDPAGALVLTELGATATTYCASLLLAAARARSAGRLWPKPGDRVALRRWPDGPVTVEGIVA